MTCHIRSATTADAVWLESMMNQAWGGLPLVIRGQAYYPNKLPGLIAENEKGKTGFLFYELRGQDCEIIVFEVFDKFKGIGTSLLEQLKTIASGAIVEFCV